MSSPGRGINDTGLVSGAASTTGSWAAGAVAIGVKAGSAADGVSSNIAVASGAGAGALLFASPGRGVNGPATAVCKPGNGLRPPLAAIAEACDAAMDPCDRMLSRLLASTSGGIGAGGAIVGVTIGTLRLPTETFGLAAAWGRALAS